MTSQAENQPQFDVFISYASVDRDAVEQLVARLENDKFSVWYDQRQISRGQVTLGQLADAIAASAHMIACLSDAYIDREFTKFELDLNQSFDPSNKRNRTVPVLIKPLTRPMPNQILAINRGDLTDAARYEEEYRRITMNIRHAHEVAPEEMGRINIDGVKRKLELPFKDPAAEPIVTLTQIRIAAESLCRFLYKQELKMEPGSAGFSELVETVIKSVRLPATVRSALEAVKSYAELAVMEGEEEEAAITIDAIQPALLDLENLKKWFLKKYELHKKAEPPITSDEPVETVTDEAPPVIAITPPPVVEPAQPAPVVIPQPVSSEPFQALATYSFEAEDAWLLGEKLLIHNHANGRLEIWNGSDLCWRSDGQVWLRRAVVGNANQLALSTWNGWVFLFQGDHLAVSTQLDGTVGDIAPYADGWVAGTWRTSLCILRENGQPLEPLAAVREGVGSITAIAKGDWFAIIDLLGGIGLYNGGRKVAAVPPFENPGGIMFLGQKILALDGPQLATINLRGEISSVENVAGKVVCRLVPSVAPDCGFLSLGDMDYQLINPSGMRRPYFHFDNPQKLVSTCLDPEKFLFLAADGRLDYYVGRSLKQSWTDVRNAHLSQDGRHLTIIQTNQVQVYEGKA